MMEGMGRGLGKVSELIFFKDEDWGLGEGEVQCGGIALNLGLSFFFFGDGVYLPGEDFLMWVASPITSLFSVSSFLIIKSFFSFEGLAYNICSVYGLCIAGPSFLSS